MRDALFLTVFCMTAIGLHAQQPRRAGELYPGITIGVNYSRMATETHAPSDIKEIATINGLGYRLGLLGGLQVSRHIAVEVKPSLAFNDSKLGVTRTNLAQEAYGQSIMVEGAAHVLYKSYAGRIIPFALGGMSYRQPLNDASASVKQMVRPSLAADIGIGIEKRFRHFSVAPEIRYSHGLSNLQDIKGINTVKMHTIIFSISFKS